MIDAPKTTIAHPSRPPRVLFGVDEAKRASEEWGLNCGPGAVAGVLGLTLPAVRPHLGDFETKRYTNPTLMWSILRSLGVRFEFRGGHLGQAAWPRYGLARIQWEGPWTRPGVPPRAAYRHTHWVGSWRTSDRTDVFDVNATSVGGWVPLAEWRDKLVPWLLAETTPRASGGWFITHAVEIQP